MKTTKSAICLTFTFVLGILILSHTESKAQTKKLSTEVLTQESTAILYGKCAKVKSAWNKEKDIIFTTITIIPEEYLKGNLGAEALITIPGGQVGDIIYEVSEMPVFTEGEEVFAFVWKHPSGKNLIIGGHQGKLKIEKDKQTGKKTVQVIASAEFDDAPAKGKDDNKPKKPEKVLLDDFISEVKGFTNN